MTTTNSKPGLQNTASRAGSLSAGTKKHFTTGSQTLTVGGASYTVTQVTTNLDEIVALRTNTVDAQNAAKTSVATETIQLPPLMLFMAAYVAYVKATFGNSPSVLADFGLVPKKARKPLTPEQKAAAKAKREATREARGTKGPVAKLSITGNVVGVTVTPITAPSPSAAQPTPAAVPTTASPPATGASGSGTAPHS